MGHLLVLTLLAGSEDVPAQVAAAFAAYSAQVRDDDDRALHIAYFEIGGRFDGLIADNVGEVRAIPDRFVANAVLHADGVLEFFGWLPSSGGADGEACAAGMRRLRAAGGSRLVAVVDVKV